MTEFVFKQKVPFPYTDFILDLSGIIDYTFHPLLIKDARLLAELMERALEVTFNNIDKVEGNKPYDLIDRASGRTIEVRVLSPTSKVTFLPSSKAAIIKARTDSSIVFDKAEKVSDWLFVETVNFPKVKAHHLHGDKVIVWLKENMNQSNKYTQSVLEKIKSI